MSLQFGTGRDAVFVSIFPSGGRVAIGEYELTLEQFCAVVAYVMTNSDLTAGDPRFELVDLIS